MATRAAPASRVALPAFRAGRAAVPALPTLRAALPALPALMLTLTACETITGLNLDMELYDALPQVEELDFSTVQPAQPFPYWELRFSLGEEHGEDTILGSGGWLGRENLPPEARATLEATRLPTGFAGGCLPSWCFKFIAAVNAAGEVITIATVEELSAFLGPVGSLAEAVLLLDAHGYFWSDEDQGIRERADGWEAVVLELVSACAPVRYDRVIVSVSPEGTVTAGRREIWQSLEGACI
jgi:hypothetical protein